MNIIYIVCHDLGRHLGCYGRGVDTPELDRFAAGGLRFDQAFCNTAVCSPSRGACMTGQYAHNNGMVGLSHFGWRIRPGVKTIVDHLNEGGYETVHCGFSHEGEENHSRYQTDFEVSWNSIYADSAVDDAVAWLRARKKQARTQPFYLNIGTMEVHPSIWTKDEDAPGVPSRLHRTYGGPVPPEKAAVPEPTPDIPLTRELFGRFESCIRFLDTQIGRLMATVRELGLDEDTLIVFSTDHGMVDWRGKNELYDRGTEIALLAQPPKTLATAPGVRPEMIQNIDLTPTLLEAASLPIPDELPGRSFFPLLCGRPDDYTPHDAIFLEWNFGGPQDDYSPIRAIRTPRHKLLHNYGPHNYGLYRREEIREDFTYADITRKRYKDYGGYYMHPGDRMRPEWELYDLEADPHEQRNLLAEKHPQPREASALKDDLAARIDDWMRRTDDHVLRGEIPEIPEAPGFHYQ